MSSQGALICDAQIHAPNLPTSGHVGGLDEEALLAEMTRAQVDCCVIVPLVAPGADSGANNGPAVELAGRHPGRFAVMGRFELTRPEDVSVLDSWRTKQMRGIRLSFVRDPNETLLTSNRLDWFWGAAERHGIPVMALVPNELVPKLGEVAAAYPGLRLAIDHLGLTPYVMYDDLGPALDPLIRLAKYPNISAKASALPASVPDPFPFRSLHEPLRRVVDTFGAPRVFWGSDLTRLKCPYSECVRLFSEELHFLAGEDREWVLGRSIMNWLDWTP